MWILQSLSKRLSNWTQLNIKTQNLWRTHSVRHRLVFIKLIILFLLGWLWVFIPVGFTQISTPNPVQKFSPSFSDTGAPVVVDGIPLFNLQAVDRFTAKDRSQFANNILIEAISTSQNINFDVNNDKSNSATSISLNNQYLLTVTANDVLPNLSPLEQANQWRSILETAIAKAKEERTPQYVWQRGLWILMAIAGLIGLQYLLGIATRIFKLKTGIFSKIAFSL